MVCSRRIPFILLILLSINARAAWQTWTFLDITDWCPTDAGAQLRLSQCLDTHQYCRFLTGGGLVAPPNQQQQCPGTYDFYVQYETQNPCTGNETWDQATQQCIDPTACVPPEVYDQALGVCVTPPDCAGTAGQAYSRQYSGGAIGSTLCVSGCEYGPTWTQILNPSTGAFIQHYQGTGSSCTGDGPDTPPQPVPDPITPTTPEPSIPDDGNNNPDPATDEGQEQISQQLQGIQQQLQNLEQSGGNQQIIQQNQQTIMQQISDAVNGGQPGTSNSATTGDEDGDGKGAGTGTPTDLYTPDDTLTYTGVLNAFAARLQASPAIQAGINFFSISVSGSCPNWVLPSTAITPAIPIDAQCSSAMNNIWPIIAAVIIATAGFVAFRWAFL